MYNTYAQRCSVRARLNIHTREPPPPSPLRRTAARRGRRQTVRGPCRPTGAVERGKRKLARGPPRRAEHEGTHHPTCTRSVPAAVSLSVDGRPVAGVSAAEAAAAARVLSPPYIVGYHNLQTRNRRCTLADGLSRYNVYISRPMTPPLFFIL